MFNRGDVRLSEVSGGDEAPAGHHESMGDGKTVSPPPSPPLPPAAPLAPPVLEPAAPVMEPNPASAPSPLDRRISYRYQASDAQSPLCWWEPAEVQPPRDRDPVPIPGRPARPAESTIHSAVMARGPVFHNAQARREGAAEARHVAAAAQGGMKTCQSIGNVVDISQMGVVVLFDHVPRPAARIWLRLERPQPTDWVEVDLKGVTRSSQGSHPVRLAFRELCPYNLSKAAVYGRPEP
jgi:hypothetical protein